LQHLENWLQAQGYSKALLFLVFFLEESWRRKLRKHSTGINKVITIIIITYIIKYLIKYITKSIIIQEEK
jgi:uncharacterized protein YfaT (DUF1175 family)